MSQRNKQNKQRNKPTAIGRTTSCTLSGRAKRYFWQLHMFCSLFQSGTRGSVQQSLRSERDGELPKKNRSMPMTPNVNRTSLPLQTTSHHHQRTYKLWESVDRESQGGEQGPEGEKVGYGGEEDEGDFIERIVAAQVQVHNLMGKEDSELVTLGYQFCLSFRTHVDQSVCTYWRFIFLVLLSWVQEAHNPMLAKVSVCARDSLSLYYCPGSRTVGTLRFFDMIMCHALHIPNVHWGMSNTWSLSHCKWRWKRLS